MIRRIIRGVHSSSMRSGQARRKTSRTLAQPCTCLRRAGFSLIELIVVISVITILLGLLIPAVQAARETTRRINCSSNLRQLSLACVQFEVNKGRLPKGALEWNGDSKTAKGRGPNSHSWVSQILPFMEEQTNYEKVDLKTYGLEATSDGREVMRSIIQSLECPTDASSFAESDNEKRHARRRSYVGCYGNTSLGGEDLPYLKHSRGVFQLGKAIKSDDIDDGISMSLLMSEIIMPTYPKKKRWQGYLGLAHDAAGSGFSGYLTPNSTAFDLTIKGPDQLYGYPGWAPLDGSWIQASHRSIYAARSLHVAGVNVVMCDGATKFVEETIDSRVWLAASTVGGRESTDGF